MRLRRLTLPILLLSLAFPRAGLGQGVTEIAGPAPPGATEDAEIVAQVVSDAGQPVGEALATAEVEDGSFLIGLPDRIDADLLEAERFGCGDDDVIELAYLPFLGVYRADEPAGRLVLTDMPVEMWSGGFPPSVAYPVYVAEPFATEGECPMGRVDVRLEVGWNWVVMARSGAEVRITTEAPPESFRWRFDPR